MAFQPAVYRFQAAAVVAGLARAFADEGQDLGGVVVVALLVDDADQFPQGRGEMARARDGFRAGDGRGGMVGQGQGIAAGARTCGGRR